MLLIMEHTKKESPIGDSRKFYCSIMLIFALLLPMVVQPILQVDATVIDGPGNTIV